MTTKHEVDIVFETSQIAINDSPVPVWHLNQGRKHAQLTGPQRREVVALSSHDYYTSN